MVCGLGVGYMRGCVLNIFSEKDRLDCTCFDRLLFFESFLFFPGLVQTDNTCSRGGGGRGGATMVMN